MCSFNHKVNICTLAPDDAHWQSIQFNPVWLLTILSRQLDPTMTSRPGPQGQRSVYNLSNLCKIG